MRLLFIASWFLYVVIGLNTAIHSTEWFNAHWGWITALYVLAIIVTLNESDSGAIRYLFPGSWFLYLLVAMGTGIRHMEWLNTNWGLFTVVYVLALVICRREYRHAKTTQWLMDRVSLLESAVGCLVITHCNDSVHDDILQKGKQGEDADPNERMKSGVREELDAFPKKFGSIFFRPRNF